ncbi:hypothetical protein EYF80_031914 [Liparis tanakae]|uniref:Uncharacterized protein n=1 Tax=Liparis tanakae TaxID=230148 RepID=A0A4Z2GYU7_9TELE|nr:hypothetical protein EYF80_031914 [Liparis tanakae]
MVGLKIHQNNRVVKRVANGSYQVGGCLSVVASGSAFPLSGVKREAEPLPFAPTLGVRCTLPLPRQRAASCSIEGPINNIYLAWRPAGPPRSEEATALKKHWGPRVPRLTPGHGLLNVLADQRGGQRRTSSRSRSPFSSRPLATRPTLMTPRRERLNVKTSPHLSLSVSALSESDIGGTFSCLSSQSETALRARSEWDTIFCTLSSSS